MVFEEARHRSPDTLNQIAGKRFMQFPVRGVKPLMRRDIRLPRRSPPRRGRRYHPRMRVRADGARSSGPLSSAVALCLVFLAAAVPLIAMDFNRGRGASDQNQFHLIAIRDFARQWPRFDFRDYPSATTPGYHVLLAAVDRYVTDNERLLRLWGALFTLGLFATLGASVARKTGAPAAMVLCLPAICSLYVFSSGAWLLPDNAAWWLVLALLLVALRAKVDWQTFVLGGLLLVLVVLVRQVHVWVAAVLCLAAWMGEDDRLLPAIRHRVVRLVLMGLACVPAAALLLTFFRLWHGTTPPSFQMQGVNNPAVIGGNPAVPATVLAIFGVYSAFYLGWLLPVLRDVDRKQVARFVLSGLLVGFILGALPQTSYSTTAGRWSGIWNLLKPLPTFHDRSPAMIALAALGGASLFGWLVALPRRDRWLFAAAWAGFVASQTAGALAWQRYYEPFILIALPLMVSRLPRRREEPSPARQAPIVLALLLALVTVYSLTRGTASS